MQDSTPVRGASYAVCQMIMFVSLNDTRNSRVSGHGLRIVLYALIRLVTIIVLLK